LCRVVYLFVVGRFKQAQNKTQIWISVWVYLLEGVGF